MKTMAAMGFQERMLIMLNSKLFLIVNGVLTLSNSQRERLGRIQIGLMGTIV